MALIFIQASLFGCLIGVALFVIKNTIGAMIYDSVKEVWQGRFEK